MQQHYRIKLGYLIYPPETQLWSFCLCSGHSILVIFSETSHVTVIGLDVLYRAYSGLYRDCYVPRVFCVYCFVSRTPVFLCSFCQPAGMPAVFEDSS